MTALLSIFMVQTALAQHDTTKVERRQHRHAKHIDKEMRLDEVVVVANGVGRVKQSAFNTLAVDTREMQNTTKNLSDALAKAPGLKLRESGRVGSDMSLMIDGFSGNHVKIFIDGVPQEGVGALFGLNNIPVSFANRIEVYKGVVPVGFGTDAIGGVVNVVTNRRHSGWHLDASYSYGSFNTHKTNLSFGQTFKGELTGTQYPDECWVAIFDNEKLDGIAWGKLLTGISTLFMVFILLTGILMWLTNRNKPLKKSLVIHLRSGWPRFWHDLHVAGGIYATIFLLALALTGLTWSFSWYRTGFYACFGVESSGGGSHGGQYGTEQSDHNRGGSGRGERGGRGEHGGYHGHGDGGGYHDHGGDGGFFGFGGHRRSPYRHWQEVLDEVAKPPRLPSDNHEERVCRGDTCRKGKSEGGRHLLVQQPQRRDNRREALLVAGQGCQGERCRIYCAHGQLGRHYHPSAHVPFSPDRLYTASYGLLSVDKKAGEEEVGVRASHPHLATPPVNAEIPQLCRELWDSVVCLE